MISFLLCIYLKLIAQPSSYNTFWTCSLTTAHVIPCPTLNKTTKKKKTKKETTQKIKQQTEMKKEKGVLIENPRHEEEEDDEDEGDDFDRRYKTAQSAALPFSTRNASSKYDFVKVYSSDQKSPPQFLFSACSALKISTFSIMCVPSQFRWRFGWAIMPTTITSSPGFCLAECWLSPR